MGVVTEQRGEIEQWKFKVRLTKVGPGIFFALFGAVVLIQALRSPMKFEVDEKGRLKEGSLFFLVGQNDADARDTVRSLNTVLSTVTPEQVSNGNLASSDLNAMVNSTPALRKLRDGIVVETFGTKALALWNRYGRDFMSDPKNVPQEHRQLLRDMEPWMTQCVTP